MSPTRRTVLTSSLGGGFALAAAGVPATAEAGTDGTAEPPCEPDPTRPLDQLRGLWIATVGNINWPSVRGLSVQEQQSELLAWFDLAVDRGYNTIFFQVRSAGQVMYDSPLEPWSAYLTGVQGQDPGYDPLAFAVEQAHARGLELHAWFNPYQLVRVGNDHNIDPLHASVRHPEWSVSYAGTQYFNPGLPDVRHFVQDAIMVAVENYDIDAVHFDDFFYPYPVEGEVFDDADAHAAYGDGLGLDDWRRRNVDLLIEELGRRIKRAKPWVKWGISPFAVWRNATTDPLGSDTTALESYDAIYADTRRWVLEEWIDYVAPQVYWPFVFDPAPYRTVVDWWCDVVADVDVALYIGEAAYQIGVGERWADPAEISNHLEYCSTRPQVDGNIYFSISSVRDDLLGAMTAMEDTWYSRPALIPAMPWVDGTPPARPSLRASRDGDDVVLTMRGDESVARWAIIRHDGRRRPAAGECDTVDATGLRAVVPADPDRTTWRDPGAAAGGARPRFRYTVLALDRAWNRTASATLSA